MEIDILYLIDFFFSLIFYKNFIIGSIFFIKLKQFQNSLIKLGII